MNPDALAPCGAMPGTGSAGTSSRLAALTWLLIVIIAAVTADLWVPPLFGYPNEINTQTAAAERLQPPSLQHPMGTDDLGRDVFSRVVYGARVSLTVGVAAVLVSVLIGLLLGGALGLLRRPD